MQKKNKVKGSKIVGLSFGLVEAKELAKRAESMRLTTAGYLKIIIRNHISSGKRLTLKED